MATKTWSDPISGRSGTDIDNVQSVTISGPPGEIQAVTFKCNAATDCITDHTAPATTELCLANGFSAGKKRARFTFHQQNGTGIPHALGAFVTVNAGDEATAIARFTTPDYGPSATARTAFKSRIMLSSNSPVCEFNLGSTDVSDIAVGFILPTGTGADVCWVDVEVW